jgi:hypothetical protein
MLARYQIVRGKRDAANPLPEGHRMDTRKHTQHILRPDGAEVEALLSDLSPRAFKRFESAYRVLLERRYEAEQTRFDELAQLAREQDVYLGCSCPTAKNPDVKHCHTVLALKFMKRKYPKLQVVLP